MADAGKPCEPGLAHDRIGEIGGKQLPCGGEREDVRLVARREEVAPDHVGDALGAVVALKPVVDERGSRSQAREAEPRVSGSRHP